MNMRSVAMLVFSVTATACAVSPPDPNPLTPDERGSDYRQEEIPVIEIAACTMPAIRQGGRGTLTTTLGPSSLGRNYSAFRGKYVPSTIMAQCCSDIGFVQLVKEDLPGWDSPKFEIDREENESQNPWPTPWYPYQTPFKRGSTTGAAGREAFMTDDPGGLDGIGGDTLSVTMSFESCAVCAIGTPTALSNRILACADWEIDFGTVTNSRKLNGSSTLYVAPDGTTSTNIRSTTAKAPTAKMKSKTGLKDLMDQAPL